MIEIFPVVHDLAVHASEAVEHGHPRTHAKNAPPQIRPLGAQHTPSWGIVATPQANAQAPPARRTSTACARRAWPDETPVPARSSRRVDAAMCAHVAAPSWRMLAYEGRLRAGD